MIRKLFQTQCLSLLLAGFVCALMCTGCDNNSFTSPEGYDLKKPTKMELGKVLNEISGLSYNPSNKTLLAVSDSKDHVFEIDFDNKRLKDLIKNFAKKNDFEDLVAINNQVYVLISNGTILKIPREKDTTDLESFTFSSGGKNDFETLYFDSSVNSLIMLCKSCADDKGRFVRTAYRFDLKEQQFDSVAYFEISIDDIKKAVKNDDADFKPSAAAINPVSKRLFVLASAGNLLVVTNNRGKVVEVYNLNPDDHPQPEGIAFAPNGDMYISNEGKYGKPTLQIFPYQQGKKK